MRESPLPPSITILGRAPAAALAIAAAALAFVAILATVTTLHAQAAPEPPDSVLAAVTQDLAARTGADPGDIRLDRAESVTWNDACLGAAEEGELCAQVLTDGWVIWLGDGTYAHRYHTDLSGAALRLAQGQIPLSSVTDAPLPAGATPRPVAEGTPTIAPFSQPETVDDFLALLQGAGFSDIPVLEIAVSRDWIPNAFSPHYIVGGATLEIFELGSPAEVEAALQNFPGNDGSRILPQDEVIWGAGSLVVILLDAGDHADLQDTISALLGPPAIRVSARLTPGDVRQHLTAAGFDLPPVVMNVAREWIPVSGAASPVDATTVEIYQLASDAAVEAALQSLRLDEATVVPPANATIWASGSLIVILLNAPENPSLEKSLSDILGGPAIVTITG
ncbi:MAG: hypothetical protein V3V06_00575, partial [Dehalococcoidia bacterium]